MGLSVKNELLSKLRKLITSEHKHQDLSRDMDIDSTSFAHKLCVVFDGL